MPDRPTGDDRGPGANGDARWLTDREQRAWRGLLVMGSTISAFLNHQLIEESGLSLQDYGVLVSLSECADGRRRPYEIGRVLGLEKSRLSHQISRLEQRGLVERERCPTDQRGLLVAITAAGRERLAQAAPGHVAAVRSVFIDRLTDDQLNGLISISEGVLAGLTCDPSGQQSEDCPFGEADGPAGEMCPGGEGAAPSLADGPDRN